MGIDFQYLNTTQKKRWVVRHHPFISQTFQIETMINNNPVIDNAAEYLKHPYAIKAMPMIWFQRK
jgi:hypothetical protein